MQHLIESRLAEHRAQLENLNGCVDRELAVEVRNRNGLALRYLHGRITMHQLVIEELDLLLAEARRVQE